MNGRYPVFTINERYYSLFMIHVWLSRKLINLVSLGTAV